MAALRLRNYLGEANVPGRRFLVHRTARRDPTVSSCCSGCCTGIARQFDAKTAAGDLHRYREKGPGPTTRLLREFVARVGVGDTVLDIGAGIGALSFELLAGGFRS